MAGMNLRGTSGFTAIPASPPSQSGTTATQQAYGTTSGTGAPTAKNGTLLVGIGGTVVLVLLWYSLPR
jgi:hypothetical protein